jgi:hypothetical protein
MAIFTQSVGEVRKIRCSQMKRIKKKLVNGDTTYNLKKMLDFKKIIKSTKTKQTFSNLECNATFQKI